MYHICFILLISNLFFFGGTLNLLAIRDNGMKMPVYYPMYSNYSDIDHFYFTDYSMVNSDFLVDKYKFHGFIYSIGDIIIISSTIVLFCYAVIMTYLWISKLFTRRK